MGHYFKKKPWLYFGLVDKFSTDFQLSPVYLRLTSCVTNELLPLRLNTTTILRFALKLSLVLPHSFDAFKAASCIGILFLRLNIDRLLKGILKATS